ncbi:peptidylprolyl isomerase [Roseimaritima sediminicola]|uniref:peptidylprolyl isomerase n=1 Tax=Roseimaritima sediminicola TaxID=2662066 RepID=UPI0012982784|nr:peptidylprolyl isomerase [Roseimaritima sediminicola]
MLAAAVPFRSPAPAILLAGLLLSMPSMAAAQQAPSPEKIEEALATELPENPAALIAVVGQSPILLGDLMPKIDRRLQMVEEQQGRPLTEEEIKYGRVNMLRGLLQQAIQAKMMGEAFLLKQAGTQGADKRAEVQKMMHSRARKLFYESQVPHLMEKLELTELTELDERLRSQGSSLESQQREFVDSMLGRMYLNEVVDQDPKITIFEIQEYYDGHRDEFRQAAQAKWEQLTVRFDRFDSRQEAAEALAAMGNEALFGGNMQAVAKKKSQEPFASAGGFHDWTQRGSLVSKRLEDQIFALPLNKMSPFIEDEVGLHIVRVLDRKEAGLRPISEVQDEIREKLRKQRIAESEERLLADMQSKVPVWSIFPEDVQGAMPLERTAAKETQQQQR